MVKIIFQRIDRHRLGPAMLFITVCGVALFFYAYFPQVRQRIPVCYFRQHTGIPCPSCGATRSLDLFIQRRFFSAFLMNPFFFALYCFFLLFSLNTLCGLLFKKNLQFQNLPGLKFERSILLAAFFINWFYLIIK